MFEGGGLKNVVAVVAVISEDGRAEIPLLLFHFFFFSLTHLLCLDDFDDNTPPLVSILFYFSRLDDDLHSLLRCDTTVAARKVTVMRAQTKRLVKD